MLTHVLVEWGDGTKNVVAASHLNYKGPLHKGCEVQMQWGKQLWNGQVLDTADGSDSDSSDSDSDIPLATLKKKKLSQKPGTLFYTIYCCNGYPHVKTINNFLSGLRSFSV